MPPTNSELKQRIVSESIGKKIPSKCQKARETKAKKYAAAHAELLAATSSRTHRLWTRAVIIIAVMVLVYYYTLNRERETKFALVREQLHLRMQKFQCSPVYQEEIANYHNCVPRKCGRFVMDKLVEPQEAELLCELARRVFSRSGGSKGGASILDLHTGALSVGTGFVNVFDIPELVAELREDHLTVYNRVQRKIQQAIADQFTIPASALHLTYPTFFSRLTNASAQMPNDEYWHEHVDKVATETYEAFHYTSLLYLSTYNREFKGGRFVFVDGTPENRSTSAIEPKLARLSAFTSGAENRHYVEQVVEGARYAVTISFTCNEKFAIADPQIRANQDSLEKRN